MPKRTLRDKLEEDSIHHPTIVLYVLSMDTNPSYVASANPEKMTLDIEVSQDLAASLREALDQFLESGEAYYRFRILANPRSRV
jgi:hypothetical protein